jgi:zinc protease
VWLVEHHDVPIVQISLVVPKGTGDDPPGQFGIASLTASMLVEGGGSRSASDIAEAVDRLKGNLAPAAGVDALSLQLHVTADGIVEALPILADVFERPTFPADAIERVKRERLSTLRQARDDPDAIGSLAFSKVVYGSAHRYGTALIGAAETIARFTREDLRAFHAATYRPETTTLIAAGDIVPGEMLKLLELNFGGWRPPAGPPQDARPIPVPQASPRRVVIVDKPGAPQTRIYVGGVGAPRVTPDFFALQVMSALLRARLTSRLGNAAAGVRAGFDMRKAAGPFVASAAVRVDSTADALAEFDSALAGMQQAPGGDELARARDDVALRLPTFESTGRITARLQLLESLLVYGLADNYYSTYVQAVRTVGAEEVARAAAAYLRPDRLSIVIVGDERAIGPGIRAMKLGPVTTMAVDEVFAPPIP